MTLDNWASLSLVLLAVEGLIITLIEGLILYFVIRGILILNKSLSKLFPTVLGYFQKAEEVTHKISDRLALPFIAINSTAAKIQTMRRALTRLS